MFVVSISYALPYFKVVHCKGNVHQYHTRLIPFLTGEENVHREFFLRGFIFQRSTLQGNVYQCFTRLIPFLTCAGNVHRELPLRRCPGRLLVHYRHGPGGLHLLPHGQDPRRLPVRDQPLSLIHI